MTQWKGRFHGFAAAANNTPENRQTLAEIFANNGSGETVASEKKAFDSVRRYNTTGDPEDPVQIMAISSLIKPVMWNPIKTLWEETLTNARYFVTANDVVNYLGTEYQYGELAETNSEYATTGEQFSFDDGLDAINAERAAKSQDPMLLIQEVL